MLTSQDTQLSIKIAQIALLSAIINLRRILLWRPTQKWLTPMTTSIRWSKMLWAKTLIRCLRQWELVITKKTQQMLESSILRNLSQISASVSQLPTGPLRLTRHSLLSLTHPSRTTTFYKYQELLLMLKIPSQMKVATGNNSLWIQLLSNLIRTQLELEAGEMKQKLSVVKNQFMHLKIS